MAITQPSSSSPLLPGPGSQTRSTDAGGGLTAAPTAGLNGAFQFLFNGSLQALQQEQTEAGTGSPLPPAGENLPQPAGTEHLWPDGTDPRLSPEMPLTSAGEESLADTEDTGAEETHALAGQVQAAPVDADTLETAEERGAVTGSIAAGESGPLPSEGDAGHSVPYPAGAEAEYRTTSESRESAGGKQMPQAASADMNAGQPPAPPQTGVQNPGQPAPEQFRSENARHSGEDGNGQQTGSHSRNIESSPGTAPAGQLQAEYRPTGSEQAQDMLPSGTADEKNAPQPQTQPQTAGRLGGEREDKMPGGHRPPATDALADTLPTEPAGTRIHDQSAQENPSRPSVTPVLQQRTESGQDAAQPAAVGTRPGLDPAVGRTPVEAMTGRIDQMLQNPGSQGQSTSNGDDREAPSRQQELQAQPVSAARSGSGSSLSAPPFTLAPRTLLTPNWGRGVGERAIMMAQHGPRVAHIQLDPPELGAMQIRIHMHGGDQVSVSFSSPNPAVRDALEQQLPRLREMFADQGLNLQDLSVSDQPSGRHSGQQQQAGAGGTGRPYGQGEDLSADGTLPLSPAPIGLVDYYA